MTGGPLRENRGLRYAILISLLTATLSKGADALALQLTRIIPLSNADTSAIALVIVAILLIPLLVSYVKK